MYLIEQGMIKITWVYNVTVYSNIYYTLITIYKSGNLKSNTVEPW